MLQPKFIITKTGLLRLGMVCQHKDLLQPGDICYGGGYYEFDHVCNRMILHGASYDFGRPRWHDIPALHVPSGYRGMQIVYQCANGEDYRPADEMSVDFVNP